MWNPFPAVGQPESAAPAESDAAEPAPPDGKEIESLRAEYLQLRDRLFRSRARAAAVASELYSTRLTVNLDYSAHFYRVRRATIRLDGAPATARRRVTETIRCAQCARGSTLGGFAHFWCCPI